MSKMKGEIRDFNQDIENLKKQCKEAEITILREKATIEHCKGFLKKKLSGEGKEEEKNKQNTQKAQESQKQEQFNTKVTVEKFLAIMQALKNEKEIGKLSIE